MTVKNLKETVRQLIGKGKLEQALDMLENWANETHHEELHELLLPVKFDFEKLKKDEIKGIIENNQARLIRSQIIDKVLTITQNLKEPVTAKPPRMSESLPETSGTEPLGDVEKEGGFIGEISKSEALAPLEIKIVPPIPIPVSPVVTPERPHGIKMATVPAPAPRGNATPLQGGLLYNIPAKMPIGMETKCIVRIAFEKRFLRNTVDVFQSPMEMDIRVAELMEVELKELGSNQAFDITALNDKQQFLDGFSATEWQFYVKPLKSGTYKLLLKVAIIERINDVDRRKEAVLEQPVTVTAEVANSDDSSKRKTPAVLKPFLPDFKDASNPNGLKTILFMGANPPGTTKVQLEVEHSRIVTKLNGKFNFPTAKFVSSTDIPELIITHKPNIIHFSGHGKDPETGEHGSDTTTSRGIVGFSMPKDYEKKGGIVVFDEDMRGMKIIDDDSLKYVFQVAVETFNIPLEVVIFNSCFSVSQAKVVGKYVPYVVGTARAIKDTTAMAFATGFYFGIANGLTIEKAFSAGKMQAVIEDNKAKDLILLYKDGKKMKM